MRFMQGAVAVAVVSVGFVFPALAQTVQAAKPASSEPAFWQAYCTATGGLVETRHAVYGTNNPPQDWLPLDAAEGFCQYKSKADGSRIHLSLQTLNAPKPTLAALAYYAQVPYGGTCEGNPASCYCSQIGGAEIGALDAAGGAWVTTGEIDDLLEACVFPDNSTIDSWGLLYHSVGTIRGIDLSTVLKFSDPYPALQKMRKGK